MKDLNAVFQPEKISHAHGLQISYLQDERMRNLFVYHENGQVNSSAILYSFLTDELDLHKSAQNLSHRHQINVATNKSHACCQMEVLEMQVQQTAKLFL